MIEENSRRCFAVIEGELIHLQQKENEKRRKLGEASRLEKG